MGRYQRDVEGAHDRLQAYKKEHKELRAIQSRQSEELKLQREVAEQTRESLALVQRHSSAEEARLKTDLANVLSEQKDRDRRLSILREQSERQEAENARLRARAQKVRSGVTVLQ